MDDIFTLALLSSTVRPQWSQDWLFYSCGNKNKYIKMSKVVCHIRSFVWKGEQNIQIGWIEKIFTLAECDWKRTYRVDWGIEEHLPFAPCNANFTHLTNFYQYFQPTLFVGIPEVIGGDQRKPIPIAIKKLQNRTIVCVEWCNVSSGFDLPPVVSMVL